MTVSNEISSVQQRHLSEAALRARERNKLRQRERRMQETEVERAIRREINRDRMRQFRQNMTDYEKELARQQNRIRQNERRAKLRAEKDQEKLLNKSC